MIINLDDFKKIEMKVGEIKSADKLENSEKLLKLSVDFGEENERQVISGIAGFFPDPNSLLGKRCAFVTNLEPKMIMGYESQAMILAASTEHELSVFQVADEIPVGTLIR
ncbi:MAG TPA: hypothetical protein VJC12_03340 [Candidatus Paceibacterota bacterium]